MAPAAARDLALGFLGTLAKLPLGNALIDFLGHARPDASLRHALGPVEFPGRIGLGAGIDPRLLAPRALSRFGVAFLEVGPLTIQPVGGGRIDRDDVTESITFHSPCENPGIKRAVQQLADLPDVRILVHLDARCANPDVFQRDAKTIIERLDCRAAGIILHIVDPADCTDVVNQIGPVGATDNRPMLLLAVSARSAENDAQSIASAVESHQLDGVYVDGAISQVSGHRVVGRICHAATRLAVSRLRGALRPGAVIVANGGVHEPIQALELIDAGCDLVSVDTGLIFSGPGLVKRINEALLYRIGERAEAPTHVALRPARMSWFWTCLMALGMVVGGLMALVIAGTRVVMPYDEATAGMTREQIIAVNERLLHFMRHDRMTLAGTMLAVGILYLSLSMFGSRRGLHWAHVSIVASAFAGFASFFLFLGFGYFDPFHAFVTAVLLQLLLLAMHSDLPPVSRITQPEVANDRAWRLSQWGQLLFILHGTVLVVAGCVIASYGITTVFVPEDLEFMETTASHLQGAHPQLVPLVAHDRATFGGMLMSCGVCVLLSSLWGFRRGHAWLWWALMTAGSIAYFTTIFVHWHVGYSSLKHLLPAYGGLALLVIGGIVSRPHLCWQTADT
jgi:dihydroorotate dehydrogenase